MIWVVGDKGMLGTELGLRMDALGQPWTGSDREVDILDPAALRAFAEGKDIRWIVNCAAYTAVDRAEDEEVLALRLNAEGPENLALLGASIGARILQISTDYVFPGTAGAPIPEDASVDPRGAYGRTKAEGERRVLSAASDSVVLRTAWLYGKHGPNFVYTMLRLMREKERIGVVTDQRGSPTWARDLADAILDLTTLPAVPGGVYHYTDDGQTTWHAFALSIHRLGRELGILDRDCVVQAITTDQYPTKARRPAYSVLDKGKVRALGISVPPWEESLRLFLEELGTILRRQRKWSAMSEYDLRSAELEAGLGRYRSCSFWCQQSIEKILKALLEFQDRPLPVHDVFKLAHKLGLPLDASRRDLLKELTKRYTESRYDMDFTLEETAEGMEACRRILASTKEFLQWAKRQNKLPIGYDNS